MFIATDRLDDATNMLKNCNEASEIIALKKNATETQIMINSILDESIYINAVRMKETLTNLGYEIGIS